MAKCKKPNVVPSIFEAGFANKGGVNKGPFRLDDRPPPPKAMPVKKQARWRRVES